ncbi:MAG: hypothetical protein NVS4B3_16540 [Gemmatimonadaceae bacterium]
MSLSVGQSVQFGAKLEDGGGNVISNRPVKWASSAPPVADVSASGLVVARSEGTAAISATADGATASADVATFLPVTRRVQVGVRTVAGRGEFFDRLSRQPFVPRGSSYVRLAQLVNFDRSTTFYHSLFNVGVYDAGRAARALAQMEALKYNVVRVFIQGQTIGSLSERPSGLSSAYIANLADFIRRAQSHGVTVMITGGWLPETKPYWDLLVAQYGPTFQGSNLLILSPGGLEAARQFWPDLMRALVQHRAPLDNVFAYELQNEYLIETNLPPYSLRAGLVTTGNGRTYDMADPAAKKKMVEENVTNYSDQVRAAILAIDPTALVTMGQFWPQEPNPSRPNDPRLVADIQPLLASQIDFIDLHAYLELGLTMAQYAQNFGIPVTVAKPLLMGEFGVELSHYPSDQRAAQTLVRWQASSCAYGFAGWLLWTWDTEEQRDPPWWVATGGGGAIADALSPARRANPCAA